MSASHGLIRFGATTAILAAAFAAPSFAQSIGAVSAVNPQATSAAPGQAQRTIVIGASIVHNEHVTTGEGGLTQILFVDSSSFSVGPNSDIVIDEFVYDPANNTGKLAASATKGVFRFVGGNISKLGETPVTVNTPSASIGIRGGMMSLTVDSEGTTAVKNFGDLLRVRSKATGAVQDIYRNDFFATVGPTGQFASSVPSHVTQAVISKINRPLSPPSNTRGGAKQIPTEVTIKQSGVPSLNSAATAQTALDASANQPVTQVAAVNIGAVSQQSIQTASQLTPVNQLSETLNNPALSVGGLGLVQGQLVWQTNADLDIHLILPGTAGQVFFGRPSITFNSGGATAALDHDNTGGTINVPPNNRVENIAVVGSNIPAGTYTFFASSFSDPNGSSAFTLTGTGNRGATTTVQTGTLASGQTGPHLPINSAGGHFP